MLYGYFEKDLKAPRVRKHAGGLLVIPEKEVPEFKRLLVAYYEGRDKGEIVRFMRDKCRRRM